LSQHATQILDDGVQLCSHDCAANVENPIVIRPKGSKSRSAQPKSLAQEPFRPIPVNRVARHLPRSRYPKPVTVEAVRQNKDRHQATLEAAPFAVNRAKLGGITQTSILGQKAAPTQ
jgi:hypothetical protein